jgi:hypothetical protein
MGHLLLSTKRPFSSRWRPAKQEISANTTEKVKTEGRIFGAFRTLCRFAQHFHTGGCTIPAILPCSIAACMPLGFRTPQLADSNPVEAPNLHNRKLGIRPALRCSVRAYFIASVAALVQAPSGFLALADCGAFCEPGRQSFRNTAAASRTKGTQP